MRLSELTERLWRAGIESAAHDARELFRHLGGFEDSALYGTDPVCDEETLVRAAERREAREPLQYILGECGFYREVYRVTPDCLIPREDTEVLVDYAVKHLSDGARFADLCTGSGCIALSVLNNTKNTTAHLSDLYEPTLAVAQENAARLGLTSRASFELLDCLTSAPTGIFDAILSNPPYVTEDAYSALEREIFFEPRAAFVAEEHGMRFYRAILKNCKGHLKKGGFFALEIGYDQEDAIRALGAAHCLDTEILRDLSGNPRVAILHESSSSRICCD